MKVEKEIKQLNEVDKLMCKSNIVGRSDVIDRMKDVIGEIQKKLH